MKFIALFHMKEGVTQTKLAEAMKRRAEYKFPDGVHLISEYWTPSPLAVVSVLEADDPSQLMLNSINWLDVFNTQILPVTDYTEGLKKIPKHLGTR